MDYQRNQRSHRKMAGVRRFEQREMVTAETEQKEPRRLKKGKLKRYSAEWDKGKTENRAGLHPTKQGCGDTGFYKINTGKVGPMESPRSPEPGRMTPLRKDRQHYRAEGTKSLGAAGMQHRVNEAMHVIQLSGGGWTEIRARANVPDRRPPIGLPSNNRQIRIPYASSSPDSTPQGTNSAKGKKQRKQRGSSGRHPLQPKPRVEAAERTRWYSNSPPSDEGVMPFRRKRSVCVSLYSVSWADDTYWGRWDGWKEIIQWGDEAAPRQKGRQRSRR